MPLLSGSVHSTTVVEKGRFVQGNFLLQPLLKKKKKNNLNHALFDRYRARMLQERRQFHLVNVLVMRRHHDLIKILNSTENSVHNRKQIPIPLDRKSSFSHRKQSFKEKVTDG